MEMCRACLSKNEKLVPLDETFIINYNLLTNLNITILDNMPQYSCETCLCSIHNFIGFREKAISSEMMLRNLLLKEVKHEERETYLQVTKNVTEISIDVTDADGIVDIKDEIKEEENEDSDVLDVLFQYGDDMNLLIDESNKVPELADVKPKRSRRISKLEKKTNLPQKIIEDHQLHCGICPKTFEERSSLNIHIESHKNHKQCCICLENFDSWYQLLTHRLVHVPDKQKKCHICLKRYCKPPYLEYHYVKIHFGGTPKLACKECPKKFENPRKLKNHLWSVHQELNFFCDFCKKGFGAKSTLRSHLKKHSEKNKYSCDLCEYSSKQHGLLKTHKIRKHSAIKIYCRNCTRVFESQEDCDKHRCHKMLYVVCPICGVRQKSKSLKRHLEKHSGVSKYECNRCPAKFKTSGGLKAHLDRHDGNRTKKCEYCNAKFYTGSVLIKHRRTHTGEKPYVCKICNKAFTGNHNLKVHMRVHGEYLINKKDKIPES